MVTIKRKVKKIGGSLSIIIGHYETQESNIEENDDVVLTINEVIKNGGK